MKARYALAIAAVAGLTVAGCWTPPPSPTPSPSPTASQSPTPSPAPAPSPAPTSSQPAPHQVSDPLQVTGTLTGPCHTNGQLPDANCTPGAYDPTLTAVTLCDPNYTTKSYRAPEGQTTSFKYNEAYPAYGLADPRSGGPVTELDHLIPLELGGANDATNLWPETPPTPNPKDSVESALHNWVCAASGAEAETRLHEAQLAIASNWTTAEQVLGVTS